jgi:lipoate-protein ligase A
LFASQIADLSAALKVNPLKFQDKAVKSFRSRVTNISSHLKEEMDVMQFYDRVIDYISGKYQTVKFYSYTPQDMAAIQELVDSKYKTWEWNFGYSPKYAFQKLIKTEGGNIEIYMNVEKGIITSIKFHGDFFNVKDVEELEAALMGSKHTPVEIKERLLLLEVGDYINKTSREELMAGLF